MTATVAVEHGRVAVFIAVDHRPVECVGIHAALHGARREALEPIRRGAAERFGGVEKGAAGGLAIRHDHGSRYMSRDCQREIARLGAFGPALEPVAGRPSPSPAFVRAPEGAGCAERFIRTPKENLLRVGTVRTVEELRLALIDFRRTCDEHRLIERHGHRSPARFRRYQTHMLPPAA